MSTLTEIKAAAEQMPASAQQELWQFLGGCLLSQQTNASRAAFQTGQAITVPVTSLTPETLELSKPVFVVVQPDGDEFLATYFDANLNATGDTQTEAVDNLKDILVSTFRRYTELGEQKLGPGPRKQLAVLQSIFRPES